MKNQHHSLRQFSIFRLLIVGLLLSTTLAVSVASRITVVKADSGEAPFGTVTQSLESAISVGVLQTCVITGGNLLCWGNNKNAVLGNGQSGEGTDLSQTTPTYVKDSATNPTQRLSNVIGVATADNHTCAIIAPLGKVKCWGFKNGLVLGRQVTSTNTWQPYPDFVKSAYTAGDQASFDASGDLEGVTSLAIGTYGSCALLNDGKVKCWGQGAGHVGNGVGYVTACTTQPTGTAGCSVTNGIPIDNIKQISKSGDTTCGIKTDGSMLCWGSDGGKFGIGLAGQTSTYPKTAGADTFNAMAIGNAQYSECGLYQNAGTNIAEVGGTVKCWGQNNMGELGRNSAVADPGGVEAVIGITNAIAIAGQERSYCALLIDTKVKCWGKNAYSMFVVAEASQSAVRQPSYMLSDKANNIPITGVAAISVGTEHVCVIMQSNGAVKCAGLNSGGRLGDGTVTARDTGTNVDAGETCTSNCSNKTLTGAGGDSMPPVFLSAEVNTSGTKIVLTYEKTLKTAPLPLTSSFDVTVGGVTRSVASVAIVGSTVELTFASPISRSLTVELTYTDPTATNDALAVQDDAGVDAATLTAIIVANNSTVDVIAPVLVSGAVNTAGTTLTLTYDEALNSTTAIPSRFTLTVAGRARTIASAVVSGSTVVLTLGSPVITLNQAVTIAYSAITADNSVTTNLAVQDTAGNDAASFTASAITVTNGSTVANLAPTLLTKEVNGTGTKIILTYDEPLSSNLLPTTTPFTITVGGSVRTISSIALGTDTATLELTLSGTAITEGQVVTIAYAAPTVNNALGNAAIQDLEGKDAASITTSAVTNTIDSVAPTFVSGAVNTGGSLVLTYSEALAEPAPATSSIVVTINGTQVTVVSVTLVGSTVVVVTSPVIGTGDVVTFRYADPTAGNDVNAIQDAAGNDAASITSAYTVPGGSNISSVDTSGPTFVSGAVNTGGSLVLTYSETLAAPAPATSSIVVTINGTQVTVVSVTLVGSTVVVVTSPVIRTGDVVTFRYTDPTTGNDASAIQDAAGNDAASSTGAYTIPGGSNGSTQAPVSTTTTTVPTGSTGSTGSTTSTTVPTSVTTTTVPTTKTVDGDAPGASTSTSETQTISGKNGKATFSDGSAFEISKDGNLIPKLFTAYVGIVTGSVKVTYKVGKKTVSTTCSYGKYGSTKPKKVKKSVNGFFPKVFISPKKKCLIPPAAIKALNTQLITIAANLKFARLWPTTAKPKNPESGAAIRPVKRAYSVKIGTAPK